MLVQKVGIIIVKNQKLLVIREVGNWDFSIPGGEVGPSESNSQAVTRVLKEELGADVIEKEQIAKTEDDKGIIELYGVKYKGTLAPDKDIQDIKWVDSNYIKDGVIVSLYTSKFVIPKLKEMKVI